MAHYDGTADEIIEAIPHFSKPSLPLSLSLTFSGPPIPPDDAKFTPKVDVLFAGVGTGGTISGLSRRLKEVYGDTIVVGIDPVGSILARPEYLNILESGQTDQYKVEGIGYDFIPSVLNHSCVDHWMKLQDDEAFAMTRRLIRTEGLLCGGSSGGAMALAIKYLQEDEVGKKIGQDVNANAVVILPDSLRNYITEPWMRS